MVTSNPCVLGLWRRTTRPTSPRMQQAKRGSSNPMTFTAWWWKATRSGWADGVRAQLIASREGKQFTLDWRRAAEQTKEENLGVNTPLLAMRFTARVARSTPVSFLTEVSTPRLTCRDGSCVDLQSTRLVMKRWSTSGSPRRERMEGLTSIRAWTARVSATGYGAPSATRSLPSAGNPDGICAFTPASLRASRVELTRGVVCSSEVTPMGACS